MKKKVGQQLPTVFKKYFWDVEFKKISLGKHLDFILSRILGLGDLPAIRWVFSRIDKRTIRQYVLNHGDRQLDKRSNNFWRVYFGLPTNTSKAQNSLWPW